MARFQHFRAQSIRRKKHGGGDQRGNHQGSYPHQRLTKLLSCRSQASFRYVFFVKFISKFISYCYFIIKFNVPHCIYDIIFIYNYSLSRGQGSNRSLNTDRPRPHIRLPRRTFVRISSHVQKNGDDEEEEEHRCNTVTGDESPTPLII